MSLGRGAVHKKKHRHLLLLSHRTGTILLCVQLLLVEHHLVRPALVIVCSTINKHVIIAPPPRLLNYACSTEVKLPNGEALLQEEIQWLKYVRVGKAC